MVKDDCTNIVEPEPTGLNVFLKIRWLILLIISVIIFLLLLREMIYGSLTSSLMLLCIALFTFFYGICIKTKKIIYFLIAIISIVPIPFIFANILHNQNLIIASYVVGCGWAMFTLFYTYHVIKTKKGEF